MDGLAGLGPNPTQRDIEDELVFEKVLVETLDPDADNYDEQRLEHEAKIEQLEAMLGLSPSTMSVGSDLELMLSPVASFNAQLEPPGQPVTGEQLPLS